MELESNEFTVLSPREPSVSLVLDRPAVEGTDTRLLRAMLLSIPDAHRIPDAVVVRQRPRTGEGCGCDRSEDSGALPQATEAPKQFVRSVTHPVPSWLRSLKVHVPLLRLADVVVGQNAQLILAGPSPMHLVAHNFHIRPGGSVIQTANHVTVNLTGELKGDA